jgi:hypothetical protein
MEAGPTSWLRYRHEVARPILRYPDGATGAALVLLRAACALAAVPAISGFSAPTPVAWLSGAPSAALILMLACGFWVRVAATLLTVALAARLGTGSGEAILLHLACAGAAAALALLGPGAWSIDAHLHGRRVIRLQPPHSPDRGSSS